MAAPPNALPAPRRPRRYVMEVHAYHEDPERAGQEIDIQFTLRMDQDHFLTAFGGSFLRAMDGGGILRGIGGPHAVPVAPRPADAVNDAVGTLMETHQAMTRAGEVLLGAPAHGVALAANPQVGPAVNAVHGVVPPPAVPPPEQRDIQLLPIEGDADHFRCDFCHAPVGIADIGPHVQAHRRPAQMIEMVPDGVEEIPPPPPAPEVAPGEAPAALPPADAQPDGGGANP